MYEAGGKIVEYIFDGDNFVECFKKYINSPEFRICRRFREKRLFEEVGEKIRCLAMETPTLPYSDKIEMTVPNSVNVDDYEHMDVRCLVDRLLLKQEDTDEMIKEVNEVLTTYYTKLKPEDKRFFAMVLSYVAEVPLGNILTWKLGL